MASSRKMLLVYYMRKEVNVCKDSRLHIHTGVIHFPKVRIRKMNATGRIRLKDTENRRYVVIHAAAYIISEL